MRPSHGRISLDGIMPLAPSFDTVGWFARDPQLFATAGRVLLADWAPGRAPARLLLARDAFERAEPRVWDALRPAIQALEQRLGEARPVTVSEEGLDAWHDIFRTVQGAEAWAEHGPWIESARPNIGPFLIERLRLASRLTAAEIAAAEAQRALIRRRLDQLLEGDALLLLPSAPGPAPRIDADMAEHERVRLRAIGITSIASLGGLPQVSLPLGRLAEGPVGLSLIAARGQDALLLDLVEGGIGEVRQTAAR
jgi:amidase